MLIAVAFSILVAMSMSTSPPPGCSTAGWNSASNETCPYTSLLQINQNSDTTSSNGKLRVASHVQKAEGNVLYVVRTWHKNYDTRLPSILETWASSLDSSSLLIVGDKDVKRDPPVYAASGCLSDHHVGLTCKTGHSLALAAEKIGNREWAFVIDDDVYVNTSNLEGLLKNHNASRLVALGIPGCGTPHCDDHQGGFCGGGGYALSQAALKALVDRPSAVDFHNELLDMTKVFYPGETPWDDITTTCLMKRRGISVERIDGLYGWRIPDGSKADPDGKLSSTYKNAIHSSSPLPLTFHYLSPKEMYTIHEQFMKPAAEKISLLQEVTRGPSYAEQMSQYINEENLRRSHHLDV